MSPTSPSGADHQLPRSWRCALARSARWVRSARHEQAYVGDHADQRVVAFSPRCRRVRRQIRPSRSSPPSPGRYAPGGRQRAVLVEIGQTSRSRRACSRERTAPMTTRMTSRRAIPTIVKSAEVEPRSDSRNRSVAVTRSASWRVSVLRLERDADPLRCRGPASIVRSTRAGLQWRRFDHLERQHRRWRGACTMQHRSDNHRRPEDGLFRSWVRARVPGAARTAASASRYHPNLFVAQVPSARRAAVAGGRSR
jgi:hypothetical protein